MLRAVTAYDYVPMSSGNREWSGLSTRGESVRMQGEQTRLYRGGAKDGPQKEGTQERRSRPLSGYRVISGSCLQLGKTGKGDWSRLCWTKLSHFRSLDLMPLETGSF